MAQPGARSRLNDVLLRTQPDARLVVLVREGQEAAMEEIVRRYRPALVAFASGIVPAHRAEDVVQESLTRAFAALPRSTGEMVLRPWLYTIVRNRAFNDLRDEPAHDPLEDRVDGVPQPPDVAAGREELASLVTRIRRLPDAQRQALVQRELEGRSHREIAASMGASPGAVRQLIFRARASLRAAGLLVPIPLLRYVAEEGYAGAGAVGLGSGGGIGMKAGAVLVVAAVAGGSGMAAHDGPGGGGDQQATAATSVATGHRHAPGATAGPGAFGVRGEGRSGSDDSGESEGDEGDGEGRSGPGGDSGPGGEGAADAHSGPGDGSGSGGSGGETSGSGGSPSSGSGSGGSLSSGSGSGGSGSGDREGSSGSGSSGPG